MKENSAMERAAGLREELGQRKEVSIELDVESGRKILKGDFSALPLEAKVRAAVAKNNLNEGVKAAERCDFREAILSAVVAQRSMCDVQTILVTEFNLAGLDRGEFIAMSEAVEQFTESMLRKIWENLNQNCGG